MVIPINKDKKSVSLVHFRCFKCAETTKAGFCLVQRDYAIFLEFEETHTYAPCK